MGFLDSGVGQRKGRIAKPGAFLYAINMVAFYTVLGTGDSVVTMTSFLLLKKFLS